MYSNRLYRGNILDIANKYLYADGPMEDSHACLINLFNILIIIIIISSSSSSSIAVVVFVVVIYHYNNA